MRYAYQGIPGSYSESCIKKNYPESKEIISCRTFQDAFELAKNENDIRAVVPEQNQLIGSINIETLILKYRLNIFAEHFFPINHSLLVLPGTRIDQVKKEYMNLQTNQLLLLLKSNLFYHLIIFLTMAISKAL